MIVKELITGKGKFTFVALVLLFIKHRDISRVKNRRKFFLMFFCIDVPKEFQGKNWTNGFVNWLDEVRPGGAGDISFGILLKEYTLLKEQRIELTKRINTASIFMPNSIQ